MNVATQPIGLVVPWNAIWTAEATYEIRPCRWVENMPAMWNPHRPNEGRPIFAKPHFVRQRQSIARLLCTVCGEHTPADDRWWFGHGQFVDQWFMTTESPVHRACADFALTRCPHLRGREADLVPFPPGYDVLRSMVGGELAARDFGIASLKDRPVVGALKLAWPRHLVAIREDAA